MFRLLLIAATMLMATNVFAGYTLVSSQSDGYGQEIQQLGLTQKASACNSEHEKTPCGGGCKQGPPGPQGLNGENGRNGPRGAAGATGHTGPAGEPGLLITDIANYVYLQNPGAFPGPQAFTGVGTVIFNTIGVDSVGGITPIGSPVNSFQLAGPNLYEVTYSISLANPLGFVPTAQFVLNLNGTDLSYTTMTVAVLNNPSSTTAIIQTAAGNNVLSVKSLTIPDPGLGQTNVFVGFPDNIGLSNLVGAFISIVKLN